MEGIVLLPGLNILLLRRRNYDHSCEVALSATALCVHIIEAYWDMVPWSIWQYLLLASIIRSESNLMVWLHRKIGPEPSE
jgi:hypothetical protein